MSLNRTTRRISLLAVMAAVLAAVLLALGPGRATPAGASAAAAAVGGGHSTKPVIVLEHGAWADASGWSGVISRLQRRGFTVYAPPNPLRGLPQDSDYLHQFLTHNAALQGKPVVLVGHSYGGAVITNAAVGASEVRALVYVDAFIPRKGDTIGGLAGGSCLGPDSFNPVPYPGGPPGDVDLYIKPDLVPGCFATGLPVGQAAVIAATQRPLAASAFTEPSGRPAWKTIPSWAIIGTGDRVIPPAQLTFMARRAGAHITDVNAGHLSLMSKPSTVTRVILQAVRATR